MVTAVLGLVALVFGLGKAETDGWHSAVTLGPIIAGVVILIAFVVIETRVAHPLLPLRVVLNRNRGGAYAAIGLAGASMFGIFLFLTYFMTGFLGFSAIQTGAAFLPMLAAVMTSATTAGSILTPRIGPRPLVPLGGLIAAGGMAYLSRLGVDSTYAGGVLPGLLIIGLGMGMIFAPVQNAATSGVEARDAGVASAMINTMQQIGGSIGAALLSSIFASASANYLAGKPQNGPMQALAALHGYHTVFWWSFGMFLTCALVSALLFRTGPLTTDADAPRATAH